MRRTAAGCLVALALVLVLVAHVLTASSGPTLPSASALGVRPAGRPPIVATPTASAVPERAADAARHAAPDPTPPPLSPAAAPPLRPLSALSPAAAALVGDDPDAADAIVTFPATGAAYGRNQDVSFPLASVAKVVIMLAVLDQQQRAGAALDSTTAAELRGMITESDNASADALWRKIGDGAGAQAYLQGAGIDGITMSTTPAWGDSTGTPHAVAQLFAALVTGTTLDAGGRAIALALLAQVDPGQTWGARLAFPASATVGIKNGWVPDEDGGWYMHSAAIDESDPAHPVVVVMTGDDAAPLAAISRIQSIARAIGNAIRSGVAGR